MNGSFLIPAGVIGPASSTTNAVATFSDTTGGFLANSSVTINAGSITAAQAILTGALNAVNVAAGATPFVELEVDSTATTSPRGIMTAQFNTGADGARLHMRKARGTRAAPTTVVTGDNLGRIVGTGYDGSAYQEMASIIFGTEGTVAATRVPTNIQFWTATNAAPSVLTLTGQFNSSQQLLLVNGTAAAPSYSFTSDATKGWYSSGSNQVGLSLSGTSNMLIDSSGGTRILNAVSASLLQLGSAGAIALTAAGTNQNIVLTPSGSGYVSVSLTSSDPIMVLDTTQTGGYVYLKGSGTSKTYWGWDGTASYLFGVGSRPLDLGVNSVAKLRISAAGNTLIGGLTTDGTGVLQFPAATTAAGGITFGTDVNFFRSAAGVLRASGTGTTLALDLTGSAVTFSNASGGNGSLVLNTDGTILVKPNGTAALSLDTSQNATFAKLITSYNGIATAGNGVVTVQGAARATAQTGANASVATYTVGASDASFEVSANILVTTATTHAFTCTCAYTDEGNTARTITLTFSNVGGTFLTSIANTGGAVPYEGVPLHIRAKASTTITIATTGTFTSVVYNVEGNIRKLA